MRFASFSSNASDKTIKVIKMFFLSAKQDLYTKNNNNFSAYFNVQVKSSIKLKHALVSVGGSCKLLFT